MLVFTFSRQRPSNGGKYDASLIVRNQECPELAGQPQSPTQHAGKRNTGFPSLKTTVTWEKSVSEPENSEPVNSEPVNSELENSELENSELENWADPTFGML